MTTRAGGAPLSAKLFAVGGWLLATVGAVGAIALRIADPVPQLPSTFGFGDTALVGFAVLGVAFASVGALLVVRRSANLVGWVMVMIGVGYAVGILFAAITFSLAAHPSTVAWLDLRVTAWLTVLFTSIGGLVFALGFIFPTGRGQTPAWDRGLKIAACLTPVMFVTVFLIRPGPLHVFPTIDNPFGVGPDLRPFLGDRVSEKISAMAVIILPLVVWSIVSRYRRAGHVERQQLKWVGLATGVAIGALAVAGFSATMSDRPSEIGLALFGFAGALVPVAIGVAILRHRLYDIDRVISRTLGYAVISGVLTIVFVALILILTSLLAQFTEGQAIAVAASTVAVFALFQPVRRSVQRTVDRRFDRAGFDAEQTVMALSGRLRDDIDLATVTGDVVEAAVVAVHPASASVWLRGSTR